MLVIKIKKHQFDQFMYQTYIKIQILLLYLNSFCHISLNLSDNCCTVFGTRRRRKLVLIRFSKFLMEKIK